MKQIRLCAVLAAEAVVLLLFGLLQIRFFEKFSDIAAFPFEQIGLMLRALSLSGPAGNVLAILLYCLFSLAPLAVYAVLWKKQRQKGVDMFLIVLSILLFPVNYFMVNPGLLQTDVPGSGKWMLGSVFYSVLFGYLILRFLTVYIRADAARLQQGLQLLLGFLNMIFVYAVFGQELKTLITSIRTVQSTNSTSGMDMGFFYGTSQLTLTYLFLVLRFLVNALPYILDIAVVFLAIRVLKELAADRYSDDSVRAVEKLAGFCAAALGITVTADMIFNVLQLICRRHLYQIDFTVVIPVVSIVFVLAVLLLAKYVKDDQKLKLENDLFI